MKKYIVVYVKSKWYALNVEDTNDFTESLPRNAKNILISCQAADLVRHLIISNATQPLPGIIDLECMDKQMSQIGRDLLDDRPWRIIKSLKFHGIVNDEYRVSTSEIAQFCENILALYNKLSDMSTEEKSRFEVIEAAINTVVYQRQSSGVYININKASELCHELEKQIYSIKNQLQFNYKIYSPDNTEQQKAYLASKKITITRSIQFTFKAWRIEDEVCRLFYDMLRAEQDLNSLLFMLTHRGGDKKCYPTYYGFGTITSRITLREPSLQNLKKENRVVIVPETGKKLLYVDYSQFEAGILASLSEDLDLINLYKTDIYNDLAEKVLGDVNKRSDAKVLFYRYIYGDDSINKKTKDYFGKFKKLEEFKKGLRKEIVDNRKIGTLNGNFRIRGDENFEWFLSHKIQSTASLIYKHAMLRVFKEVPTAQMLIPMHDATLYEITLANYDFDSTKIQDIYREEFQKICPQIVPIINPSDKFA